MTLDAVIRDSMSDFWESMGTIELAVVTEFTPPTGGHPAYISARPLIYDEEGRPKPEVCGVPVLYPQSTSYGTWFSLAPGDQVLLLFARGVYEWKITGGPVGGDIGSRGGLNDALAIPGLLAMAQQTQNDEEGETDAWIAGYHGASGYGPGADQSKLLQFRQSGIKFGSFDVDVLGVIDSLLAALLTAPLVDPVTGLLNPTVVTSIGNLRLALASIMG